MLIASLYTIKEQREFEMKNTLSFTLSLSKKEIGINLTKYVHNLYEENSDDSYQRIEQMESYFMFMDKKTKYCQDVSFY